MNLDANTVVSAAALGFVAWRLGQMLLGKVSPARAKELVAQGATLLDVRSFNEYAAGHLGAAKHIPVHELQERLGEVGDRARPVVVYCASGVRSARAAGVLRRAGFSQVFDLGAMARWPG